MGWEHVDEVKNIRNKSLAHRRGAHVEDHEFSAIKQRVIRFVVESGLVESEEQIIFFARLKELDGLRTVDSSEVKQILGEFNKIHNELVQLSANLAANEENAVARE